MAQFFFGLDIGKAADYTALAVVRRVDPKGETEADRLAIRQQRHRDGKPDEAAPIEYHVLAFDRLPLGMPYPAQVEDVKRRLQTLAGDTVSLVVDKTGVGAPVVDLFDSINLAPIGILIHGGQQVTKDTDGYHVPKRDLIAAARVLLETDQLKIASRLKLWKETRAELLAFEQKTDANGHDRYANNPRETPHDDLVLALSMACWFARQAEAESGYWRNV